MPIKTNPIIPQDLSTIVSEYVLRQLFSSFAAHLPRTQIARRKLTFV